MLSRQCTLCEICNVQYMCNIKFTPTEMSVLMDFRGECQHFSLKSAGICFITAARKLIWDSKGCTHFPFHRRINYSEGTNTIRQRYFWKGVSCVCILTPQNKSLATTERCAGKLQNQNVQVGNGPVERGPESWHSPEVPLDLLSCIQRKVVIYADILNSVCQSQTGDLITV